MKPQTIKRAHRKELNELLDKWLKKYTVLAPVRKENILLFSQVQEAKEVILDSTNTRNTPKEAFLPQSEVLFRYGFSPKNNFEIPSDKDQQLVLIGVKPCDVKAINLLDGVFSGSQFQDLYFKKRRKNSTIIGLACSVPESSCFCTRVNSGPFAREGSDLFLIKTGENYLLEVLTEKGEKLPDIQKLPPADQQQIKIAKKIEDKVSEKMKAPVIEDITEKLRGMFEHPLWEDIHQRCLGCGVCTYLCPTCYCFDIQDIPSGYDQGKRIRSWDSCMFSSFTLQASGYNPRSSLKQRLRQRIMHKFNYFVENYGVLGCVGCGRCIKNCPAGIDIREIIQHILSW